MNLCSIDGCTKTSSRRGWCDMHYRRWVRNGDPLSVKFLVGASLQEKFDFKSDLTKRTEDGCSEWTGNPDSKGYGLLFWNRKQLKAHVVSWELANGRPVTLGMQINHHCDNPSCVLPEHLYEGTPQDNVDDRVSRGRNANIKGERHWNSKITEQDVVRIRSSKESGKVLAERYGVSMQHISGIRRRDKWSHVT